MTVHALFIQPLESLMGWLYALFYASTGNYGFSIILLSLTVNTVLLPLYAIADRLKNNETKDKDKMASELENISNYSGAEKHYYIREIYRRHHYHPLKSLRVALGFLIQVPFFIAAYQFLGHYLNFSGVGFLFINDLSRPDALLKGINILPFVMTSVNLMSAFVFARGVNKSDRLQLYGLSGLFLVLLYNSPAALVLYWTTSNVFSLGKSWFLSRKMGDSVRDETTFLTRENLRQFLAGPIGDRIAFVSLAPAVYVASMSYLFLDQKRFLILSCLFLGILFIFQIVRFALLSERTTSKTIVLVGNALLMILSACLLCEGLLSSRSVIFSSSASSVLLSIIVEMVGIAALYLTLPRKFSLSKNMPVLSTILLLNLLSVIYVTDIIEYAAMMPLIMMLSLQLSCGDDFLPHERRPLLHIMAGTLFLLLSVFVLTPLKFVLTNPEDYIIPIKDFFPFLTLYTLLLAASLFLIFHFLVRTKLLVAYVGLFCIVVYFVYSSIPYDVGQVKDFMFENPDKLNVPVSLRLVEIVVVSCAFYLGHHFMVKKKGIIRFSRSIVAITIILPSFFSVQVVELFVRNYDKITSVESQKTKGLLLPLHGEFGESSDEVHGEFGISSDQAKGRDKLTLSSNGKNIIVIFLDSFSSQLLPDLLEKKPALVRELDGFVWYKDTITSGSWTVIGTPGIWGGHDYTPDKVNSSGSTRPEAFYGAYKIMPTEMLKRGFKVNYYNQYVYTNLIETIADGNFKSLRIGSRNKDLYLLHGRTYLAFLPRVTLFIGSPFFMKSILYDDGSWRSVVLAGADSSFFEKRMDWEALSTLSEYTSEPLGDVFTFFMSLSTHGPYFLDWNGVFATKYRAYWDYEGGIIASYYALKSVVDLVDKLKSDALYENTKIILVSDHGNLGVPKTQTKDPRNIIEVLPTQHGKWFDALLMVKEFDASGPLRTDDTRFMSNADVLSFALGKGDQIPAGRTLIHTARYGDEKGGVMIQMDTSLNTDRWKILKNDITTDCRPDLPGCAQ